MSCDTRPSSIPIDGMANTPPGRRSSAAITIASPAININPSDGFSSPRDSAHTPPGIVTKIETRIYKNTNPGSATSLRCVCASCNKDKENSFCKICTKEKLKFYSRKEALAQKQQEKTQLSEEIDVVAGASCQLDADQNATSERIDILRKKIAEKRRIIEEKKLQNRHIIKSIKRHMENIKKFEPFLLKLKSTEGFLVKKEAKKRAELAVKLQEVSSYRVALDRRKLQPPTFKDVKIAINTTGTFQIYKLRRDLGLILSGIFPVTEILAEVVPSRPSSNWALVSRTEPIVGQIFRIRGMNCPDDLLLSKLALGLSQSPLELSEELRPCYASLLLTVQLVNLLAFIMDCRLPFPIALKEISLRDRWSKELLDDEWFKLCRCILTLGLRIGMGHETLHFNCPHSNLIEIGLHILKGKIVENLQPIGSDNNICEKACSVTGKLLEREMQDWDIIDGEEF